MIIFELKNRGATYQHLVTRMFQDYITKIIEVYIDYMLVKSILATAHLRHLRETFTTIQKYNIKIKPEKYALGVAFEKFLGVLISNMGIEVNPN